jgi:hypothetical protein
MANDREEAAGMSAIETFAAGGYRYIPALFQYSSGVAAAPGFEIERARFARPVPLAEGFRAAEAHLRAIGRPITAFAACELRTPAPFTEQGFYQFNQAYVGTLQRWGIYTDGEQPVNPVARTNVCPMYSPPGEPMLYAFSYAVPARSEAGRAAHPTFVVAGAGETAGSGTSYRDRIVRAGDTSPEAMREKANVVIAEMESRLQLFGLTWQDAGSTQVYTVQNIGHLVGELLAARGACEQGLVWSYARPPVLGLEFEMAVRCVARDLLL